MTFKNSHKAKALLFAWLLGPDPLEPSGKASGLPPEERGWACAGPAASRALTCFLASRFHFLQESSQPEDRIPL